MIARGPVANPETRRVAKNPGDLHRGSRGPGTGTSPRSGRWNGYNKHVSVEPIAQLIIAVAVTPANAPDPASAAIPAGV